MAEGEEPEEGTERTDAATATADADERSADATERQNAYLRDQLVQRQTLLDQAKKNLEIDKESTSLTVNELKVKKQKIDIEQLSLEIARAELANDLTTAAAGRTTLAIAEKTLAIDQLRVEASKETANVFENAIDQFAGMGKYAQLLNNQLVIARQSSEELGDEAASFGSILKTNILSAAQEINDRFTVATIGLRLMTEVVSATVGAVNELDAAAAGFVKTTGVGRAEADQFFGAEMHIKLRKMGLSMTAASESAASLRSSFLAFNEMSEADAFARFAAQMDNLGVNTGQAADTLYFLGNVAGPKIEDTLLEIAGTAQTLEINMSDLANQIAQVPDLFIKNGPRAIEVFKQLAAVSKETGSSVADLVSSMSQFDTFEGAAQAAGRLSIVLGTSINTYELLNANEAERIELLKQTFDASGKVFDDLNRFEKIQISNALGLSLEQTARLLGNLPKEFNAAREAADAQGLSTEDLAQLTRDSTTAMEQFRLAFQQLAVAAEPLAMGLAKVADFVSKMGPKGVAGLMITTLVGLKVALVAVDLIAKKFITSLLATTPAAAGAAGAESALAASINAAALSLTNATVAAAANTPVINAAGASAGRASVGFGMLGRSLLIIGGVALGAIGIFFAIKALTENAEAGRTLQSIAVGLAAITGIVSALAFAFGASGGILAGGFIAAGAAIAAVIGMIGVAALLYIPVFNAFGKAFDPLNDLIQEESIGRLGTFIGKIRELKAALTGIPEQSDFSVMVGNLEDMNTSMSTISPSQYEGAVNLINAANTAEGDEGATRAPAALTTAALTALLGAIDRTTNAPPAALARVPATPVGATRPIEIRLDGQVLGRWLESFMEKRYRLTVAGGGGP